MSSLVESTQADNHRAYVARSLGDLLLDVDPCETVEYVMPLLSGFTMDNGMSSSHESGV